MAKRYIHKIIIALGFGLALLACTRNGRGSAPDVTFDSLHIDRSTAISQVQGAPTCQVSLSILYAKGKAPHAAVADEINKAITKRLFDIDGKTVKQAADSFAVQYVDNYRRDMGAMYAEDHGDESKRNWYEYRYHVKSAVSTARDGHFIYIADIDYFEGGVHGNKQTIAMNFDGQTGHLLTLDDILVPGFQSGLNRKLLEALLRQTGTESLEALHKTGYLFSMDMFTPDNFIIGDADITFIYNPYEIATYDKGGVTLKLGYDELDDLLIHHRP